MNIAVNATGVDDIPSGLGIYTINIVREIHRIHKNIDVYTSRIDLFRDMNVHKTAKILRPSNGMKGHIMRIIWSQTMFRAKVRRADIVFSPTQLEGVVFPSSSQVITIHDVLPLRFPEEYPRLRYYFYYFLPHVIKKSKAIITDSEYTKRELIFFYGLEEKKIRVVYMGFDKIFSSISKDVATSIIRGKYKFHPYILYVGNLYPHKNLLKLIEAYSLISDRLPHRLVIIGRKDPRSYPGLKMRVLELGIEEKVIFLDYVSREELSIFYSAANIFIFPSLYEGFGLPPLEAMACGCPVVVSNTSSLPEVCGDAVYYFDPYDVDSIAEGMYKVLYDEDLRTNMIKKGYERTKRFSWEKSAREHIKIFEEILRI